jgi:putative metallohydrolase (TIGR04338 family)
MSDRDTQRKRVYDAERDMTAWTWTQTIANDDLSTYVATVMNRRAVRARWGARHVSITLKRGGKAYGGYGRISLPKGARNEPVILHELAHVLAGECGGWHGPQFTATYLLLVRTMMGRETYTELRAAYKANRVKVGTLPPLRAVVPLPHALNVDDIKAARRSKKSPAPKPPRKPRQPGMVSALRLAQEMGVVITPLGGDRYDGFTVELEAPTGYRFTESDCHVFDGIGDDVRGAWRDAYRQLTFGLTHCVDDQCNCGTDLPRAATSKGA